MNAFTNPVHLMTPAMMPGESLLEYVATHGTLDGITNEAYHADRSCYSSTALKELLRSPAHFKHYMETRRKETAAMFYGTAIHARLLEPETFAQSYVTSFCDDKRLVAFKEFAATVSDRKILTAHQTKGLEIIARNVAAHDEAMELLDGGVKEQTLVWQDAETRIWLKIRPDCLNLKRGVCLDIKSTQDANKFAFRAACRSLNYHFSAAMYLEGLRACFGRDFDFQFLAIENDAPYQVNLLGAPIRMIEAGTRLFRQTLRTLRHCLDTGAFPGYQPDGRGDMLDWPEYY